MKGDSFRRQAALAEAYAIQHRLELDRDLTFRDLGVSAFRGKNAETGRLGDFRQAVADGLVPAGSFLLVESLDRISRQAARKAIRVLEDIVDQGVTVVTLNDGRAYDKGALDNDPMALLIALLTFIRANEESAMKSRRLRAAWEGKRQRATSGVGMTARCPSWLRLDPVSRQYVPIPQRAEVVARIFQMASDGIGLHGIAATLNTECIPTFGDTTRKAEFWNRSYVAKIIESPAVIGTFVPHTVDYTGGTKRRVPDKPIEGYFPSIVDIALHGQVRLARLNCRAPSTRTANRETASMLAGLAGCPLCGATMTRVSKGAKGGKPRLTCVRAKKGACGGASVPQPEVEDALIYWADSLARVPSGGSEWEEAYFDCKQRIIGLDRLIASATSELIETQSPAVRDRLRKLEAERAEAVTQLKALEARAIAAGPGLQRAAHQLRDALRSQPLNRLSVNGLLRQMFDAVTVDAEEAELRFFWKHGVEQALPLDVKLTPPLAPGYPTPLADAARRLLSRQGRS
nr:recombinase family protein [Belnapia mucosa]